MFEPDGVRFLLQEAVLCSLCVLLVPAAKHVGVGRKFARHRYVAAVLPPVVYMVIGAGGLAAVTCLHRIKLDVKVVVIGIVPVGFLVHSKNSITEVGSHFPKLPPVMFPHEGYYVSLWCCAD